MAYKQGVARGASIALLFGSVVLLSLYVACSALSCRALTYSFLSPVWTGVLLMATAVIGIFMSTTKSEKGCGGLFLFFSLMGIFVTIGCTCITLYAFVWEISLHSSSSVTYNRYSYARYTTPATTVVLTTLAATQTDPGVFYGMWLCMMCVAFVMSIVTCVTSCQFCCCQEPYVPEQRVFVLTQGQTTSPHTIVNQQQLPPGIVLNTVQQPGAHYIMQQPYQGPQQAFPGPVAAQPAPFFQPPPPYAAASPRAPPYNPQVALGASPQQQLAPPQQGALQPSAPPPPSPTWSHTSRTHPDDSQVVHTYSDGTGNSGAPSPSLYQPLIQETRQGTESDAQYTYADNPQGPGDFDGAYTYVDAGPAVHSTAHRSNYNPQPTPGDNSSDGKPTKENTLRTPGDGQLYESIKPPSDEYDDTLVDPNPGPPPTVEPTDYVNSDIGKRTNTPKRTR